MICTVNIVQWHQTVSLKQKVQQIIVQLKLSVMLIMCMLCLRCVCMCVCMHACLHVHMQCIHHTHHTQSFILVELSFLKLPSAFISAGEAVLSKPTAFLVSVNTQSV